MADMTGFRRLAEQCAPDSPTRTAFADWDRAVQEAGETKDTGPAIEAWKRVIAGQTRDLHDIALKSAVALQALSSMADGMQWEAILLSLVNEIVRVGGRPQPAIKPE